MKEATKVIHVLVTAVLLIWFVVSAWLLFNVYAWNSIKPWPGRFTYADFVAKGFRVSEVRRLPESAYCIIGVASAIFIVPSSGPPGYVFGADGVLLDYSADLGDAPLFRKRWSLDTAPVIPQAEFQQEMKTRE